jgi:transposase
LEGKPRKAAAETCGMDRQTLRDWVHRYKAEGLAGLCNRPHAGGPACKLSQEQTAELAGWVRSGPKPGGRPGGALAAEGLTASHRRAFRADAARAQRR